MASDMLTDVSVGINMWVNRSWGQKDNLCDGNKKKARKQWTTDGVGQGREDKKTITNKKK